MAEIYPEGTEQFYPFDNLSDDRVYGPQDGDTAWLFNPFNADYMGDTHRKDDENSNLDSLN
jgi:hypothetical protein